MTDGKAISGGDFYPPPAAIWNNMIDAGRAWADNRLNNGEGQPIRPRETDIIKLQNKSGASRRLGEVLKIEGKAITTVSDEHIWLLGVEPTADCYFGILKRPMLDDEIDQVQVSGCCMALVNVTNAEHTRAGIVNALYVLESSDFGPLEILYKPSGTGEFQCVVRFAACGPVWAVNIGSLAAASHPLTGHSTGVAGLFANSGDDLVTTDARRSFIRRDTHGGTIADGTLIQLDIVSGKLTIVWADCDSHADLEGLETEQE